MKQQLEIKAREVLVDFDIATGRINFVNGTDRNLIQEDVLVFNGSENREVVAVCAPYTNSELSPRFSDYHHVTTIKRAAGNEISSNNYILNSGERDKFLLSITPTIRFTSKSPAFHIYDSILRGAGR